MKKAILPLLLLAALAADAAREGFVFKGKVDFLDAESEYDAEFLFYGGTEDSPGEVRYGRKARVRTDADKVVNCVVTDGLAEIDDPPQGSQVYRTSYSQCVADCAAAGGMMVALRAKVGGEVLSTALQRVAPVPFASRVLVANACNGDFTATDGTLTFKSVECGTLSVAADGATLGGLSGTGAAFGGDVSVHGKLSLPTEGASISVGGQVNLVGDKSSISCGNELPVGSIIAWTGSELPSGDQWKGVWALCDGNNGTPDLVNRFIIGTGTYQQGATQYSYAANDAGGAESVTIDESTYPAHTHTFTLTYPYTTIGGINDYKDRNDGVWANGYKVYTTTTSASLGGGKPHNNMPPYYKVVFIQRVR